MTGISLTHTNVHDARGRRRHARPAHQHAHNPPPQAPRRGWRRGKEPNEFRPHRVRLAWWWCYRRVRPGRGESGGGGSPSRPHRQAVALAAASPRGTPPHAPLVMLLEIPIWAAAALPWRSRQLMASLPLKRCYPRGPMRGGVNGRWGPGGAGEGSGRSFQPRPATAGGMSRKEDRRERGGASGLAFPPGPPFRPPSSSASLSSKAGRLVGDRDEIAWGSQPPPTQTGETRSPLRLERKRQ